MKKFRKSFVILPALATMALTTVASVTGTVAWFTASRQVSVTASHFTSTAENSSLRVNCSGNTYDGISSAANNAVVIDGKLTHGSYWANCDADKSLYVATIGDDGNATGYKDLGTVASHYSKGSGDTTTTESNKWLSAYSAENAKIWYGVAWTMTFTYSSASGTNYLMFDIKDSTFTDANNSSGNVVTTAPGFRMAFMNPTDDKLLVVGGDEVKTYIKGTDNSDNSKGTYEDAAYAKIGTVSEKVSDGADGISSNKYNLGTFAQENNTGDYKVTLTCVAWYEGTDEYVQNEHKTTTGDGDQQQTTNQTITMADISANLIWYARSSIAM